MGTLQFDLNELVSKEIGQKIENLEKRLEQANETIQKKNSQIQELTNKVKKSETVLCIVDFLRTKYSEITEGEHSSGDWYDSKAKNKFLFIEKVMLSLYNIPKEGSGWLSSRSDGSLSGYLAVNYYKHKQQIIDLLKVFGEDDRHINFISGFKMPYDYPKSDVIQYVKNPNYNTNGCIFEVSQYWVEAGAAKSNMPHGLIMKSKYIVEDDVFTELLNSIKKRVSNYYYLYAVTKYHTLSKKQIQDLGETLIGMKAKSFTDTIKEFVSLNLLKFNDLTLDYFYGLITSDNQFNTLLWGKFPTKYQMKYLNNLSMDDVLKTITNYSCKWTTDEKQEFLKNYTNKHE
ncbi:MAG TPA: hypothetical protein PK431_13940 [Chitinophagales bacterium]|nr:hypothetical protein [Chitinophagales bacterium]